MPQDELDAPASGQQPTLVVMVPGMGMQADDFRTNGMIEAVERRNRPPTSWGETTKSLGVGRRPLSVVVGDGRVKPDQMGRPSTSCATGREKGVDGGPSPAMTGSVGDAPYEAVISPRVLTATVDPGPDSYFDGSVEARLLEGIAAAREAAGASCVWLAGISLGCQGIFRCVRRRPGLADGLLLLTPYLASTGLIVEVARSGGLRRWATAHPSSHTPERSLLAWLGTASPASLPPMLIGHAEQDRFATTASLLADMVPPECMISVPGPHDWSSWAPLWRQMLDRDPFSQPMAATL